MFVAGQFNDGNKKERFYDCQYHCPTPLFVKVVVVVVVVVCVVVVVVVVCVVVVIVVVVVVCPFLYRHASGEDSYIIIR